MRKLFRIIFKPFLTSDNAEPQRNQRFTEEIIKKSYNMRTLYSLWLCVEDPLFLQLFHAINLFFILDKRVYLRYILIIG
ncbi:hypothetical protein HLVA_07370 [Haliovirga abyssi]|uniref:Uncharacterized protein n=1 Tax=Haliovirga abyssi TaxID=2996794 RepID=A0AAU9DDB7_9FUSO|nr:hypothetical protein HLVA_07370 [Haliovirga abyssi]